jgi:hypothetical protein
MKIRLDYVTNSSSSSFVCEICGQSETQWDDTPDWYLQCENYHGLCDDHIDEAELEKRYVEGTKEYELWEREHQITKEACPLCSLAIIQDETIVRYLNKIGTINKKQLVKDLKEIFGSMEAFNEYIKKDDE